MLEAVHISHEFQHKTPFCRRVLHEIVLKLRPGETLLLTGPSGSGKTTLVRILAGLEPPTQGAVRLYDQEVYGEKGRSIPAEARVVMACQYPERQFFANTVLKELTWGLRVGLELEESEISRRLAAVSANLAFPLAEFAHRSPRTLSTGQQRKAALVSMLALEPHLLILDEPLAGLDLRERRRLAALLRHWGNQHRAMIVVAHELELFLDWVDHVAVMEEGRLIFRDTPKDLCQTDDPSVTEAVSLPPLVELGRRLKHSDLCQGGADLNPATVCQRLLRFWPQDKGNILTPSPCQGDSDD